jgi:glycosyltransferase involved in cell wall biosynthesis
LAIDTFSIWRSSPSVLLSDVDREEFESTHAFLPPRPLELAAALASALTRPVSCVRTLWRALRLGGPGLRGRLLGLTWFAESMALWRQCRRRGIRHVHVHLGGTASAVALLSIRFANGRARRNGGWSWSMTVHGPADFHEPQLATKVREARFVVCISDFARSQLMLLVEESHWAKLHVVHCGVDVDTFSPRPPSSPPREPRPARILTVGRLDRIKGQGVVLEAMAALGRAGVPAELIVVGDGPRRGALEAVSRGLGLERRVRWCGAIGQDSIRKYYAEADVFCLASFAEGVPVVLMEAMATELPVVATRITGVPELVDHGVNGLLVRPGRADQLAAALEELIADPELGRRMGRAGREKVAAEYDLRKSGRELDRLFRGELSPVSAGRASGAVELELPA